MIKIANKNYNSIKAILLDKDGTLIEIEALHIPLMVRRAKKISELSKKDIENQILKFWGIDLIIKMVDVRGPFMAANKAEEQIVATSCLYMNGIDWQEARLIVKKAYDIDEATKNETNWNKPRKNVISFIQNAFDQNYILGIATGDTTLRAEEACSELNITRMMSVILGVDKVKNDKPFPDLVNEFSLQTKIKPEEIMMIGDSIKDAQMARNANVGLVVGIISGVTKNNEFSKYTDHVITNFSEISIS